MNLSDGITCSSKSLSFKTNKDHLLHQLHITEHLVVSNCTIMIPGLEHPLEKKTATHSMENSMNRGVCSLQSIG